MWLTGRLIPDHKTIGTKGKVEELGTVEAVNFHEAYFAAIKQFNVSNNQRDRLSVAIAD
jgi:hypothetical protein